MVPIATAEELADDADAKGCMCLEGSAKTQQGIFVIVLFVSLYNQEQFKDHVCTFT